MFGYIAGYNGKTVEIAATSLYAAKMAATMLLNPPKSKAHMVWVALAEKDGEPVIHMAVD
jgi:hypothetical protein